MFRLHGDCLGITTSGHILGSGHGIQSRLGSIKKHHLGGFGNAQGSIGVRKSIGDLISIRVASACCADSLSDLTSSKNREISLPSVLSSPYLTLTQSFLKRVQNLDLFCQKMN